MSTVPHIGNGIGQHPVLAHVPVGLVVVVLEYASFAFTPTRALVAPPACGGGQALFAVGFAARKAEHGLSGPF